MPVKKDCDVCGNSDGRCASCRTTMATCEKCGRSICLDCIREMAIAKGMGVADAGQIESADGFMQHCEECGDMCPECFEEEKESDES